MQRGGYHTHCHIPPVFHCTRGINLHPLLLLLTSVRKYNWLGKQSDQAGSNKAIFTRTKPAAVIPSVLICLFGVFTFTDFIFLPSISSISSANFFTSSSPSTSSIFTMPSTSLYFFKTDTAFMYYILYILLYSIQEQTIFLHILQLEAAHHIRLNIEWRMTNAEAH